MMDDTDENVVVTREVHGARNQIVDRNNNFKNNIQLFIQKTVKSYEKQVAKQLHTKKVN